MRVSYVAAALMVAGMMVSCTSDSGGGGNGGGGGASCARAATKLRSCGLATEGVWADCREPDGAAETCEFNCYVSASCGDLEMDICADTTAGALATCLTACEAQNVFACGGGEEVSTSDRCDGFDDCSNSADEMGCPEFACGGGEVVPESYQCDGFEDCANGTDEVGCSASLFTCVDGETIDLDFKCDGDMDCTDGTDEVGCPAALTITCN